MIEPLFALYLALCTPNKAFCIYETTPATFVSAAVCYSAAPILKGVRERALKTTLIIDEVECFIEKGA